MDYTATEFYIVAANYIFTAIVLVCHWPRTLFTFQQIPISEKFIPVKTEPKV